MNTDMGEREGESTSEHAKHTGDGESEHELVSERENHAAEYVRLIVMAVVILANLSGWWRHWMSRDWLAFVATLVGGFPIFEEAWENVRKRRMTMELSMTIALLAALCIGQFLTALVIAFSFFLPGLAKVSPLAVGGGGTKIVSIALPG